MSKLFRNYCDAGGWVVNGDTVLFDHYGYDVASLPSRGCSHIWCSLCNAVVRNFPGVKLAVAGRKPDLGMIYALERPDPAVFKSGPAERFYFCKCSFHDEWSHSNALDDKDSGMQIYSWRCAGHPYAGVPHKFDGQTIDVGNVDAIARRAIEGWTPAEAGKEDSERAYWIARLFLRVERTQLAREILRVAAVAMEDADVTIRTRALVFFMHTKSHIGASRSLALLQGPRTLFAGVADTMTPYIRDKTLEETLWRLATPLVGEGPARDLARTDAVTPGKASRALYDALVKQDSEWTLEHLEDLAKAAPAQVPDFVEACKRNLSPKATYEAAAARIRAATA
jgi:hypothetical protein